MATHNIHSEIEIDAKPERVWDILTAFDAYPEWNPFIRSIKGEPHKGEKLEATIGPTGSKPMTFKPVVLEADTAKELRWLGHFLVPHLFDGEHRFAIRPTGEGKTLLEQSEQFTGLLVPLFRSHLDTNTVRGFEEMNRALKQRAEAT